jgi:hypothetical protein
LVPPGTAATPARQHPVERLDDDIAGIEEAPNSKRSDSQSMCGDRTRGIDFQRKLGQAIGFKPADMLRPIRLASKIRRLNPVKIGKNKPLKAASDQAFSSVRAQSAQPGNPDRYRPDNGKLSLREVGAKRLTNLQIIHETPRKKVL